LNEQGNRRNAESIGRQSSEFGDQDTIA
jgi:hypothetical protein